MKIALTIPLHLRGDFDSPAIRKNLAHLDGLGYRGVVCGSEGALSEAFFDSCDLFNLDYVEIPQARPAKGSGGDAILRKKFNESLQAIKGFPANWFCLVGANDIVSREFWTQLESTCFDHPTLAGLESNCTILMGDTINNRSCSLKLDYLKRLELAPGVNCFNRIALNHCEWQPYRMQNDEVGVETFATMSGWQIHPITGTLISLKGRHDLNTYDHITKMHGSNELNKIEYLIMKEYLL